MNLIDTLRASRVERCHSVPKIQHYSVGLHVMRSLILADFIYEFAVPNPVFRYILHHDAPELYTGDIPWPTKQVPRIKNEIDKLETYVFEDMLKLDTPLPDEHKPIVKSIDMMELMFFMKEEQMLGNRNNHNVWERGTKVLTETIPSILATTYRQRTEQAWEIIKGFTS